MGLVAFETVGRLSDLSEGRFVKADERHMGTVEALAITFGTGYVAIELLSSVLGMPPAAVAFWLAYACVASLAFLGMASPYAVRAVMSDMAHGWADAFRRWLPLS